MDYRILVLLFFIVLYGVRVLYVFSSKRNPGFLVVSLFVFFLPFTVNLTHFPNFPEVRSGAFNQTFGLEIYLFFFVALSVYALLIQRKLIVNRTGNIIAISFLLVFLFSYLNPANTIQLHTLLLFIRLFLFLGVFVLISQVFKRDIVFKGIFDGFAGLVFLQFVLAIAYPILGIKEVTNLFLDGAMHWAVEGRGGRNSAIGIFGHPGNLALFMTVCIAMFYSCFLHNINKRGALFFLGLSIVTLFLTLSRSGLLAIIISFPIMFIVYRKPDRSVFSLRNILIFVFGSSLLLLLIIALTPIGDYFHDDNFADMGSARMIHWVAGYEVFIRNPLLGVGLNTHLNYFAEQLPILDGFFARSPIHNIHIIILSEMGLLGLLFWFAFIVKSIKSSQRQLTLSPHREVSALNLTLIGVVTNYFIYGFFGWAPFANEQLSIFFLIYFFAYNYKERKVQV